MTFLKCSQNVITSFPFCSLVRNILSKLFKILPHFYFTLGRIYQINLRIQLINTYKLRYIFFRKEWKESIGFENLKQNFPPFGFIFLKIVIVDHQTNFSTAMRQFRQQVASHDRSLKQSRFSFLRWRFFSSAKNNFHPWP